MKIVNNSGDSRNKSNISFVKRDHNTINSSDNDPNNSNQNKIDRKNMNETSDKCDVVQSIGERTSNVSVFNNGIQSEWVNSSVNNSSTVNVIDNTISHNNLSNSNTSNNHLDQLRTFTSTEAQTDDCQEQNQIIQAQNDALIDSSVAVFLNTGVFNSKKTNHLNNNRRNGINSEVQITREQRRRERRERRQPRNARQQHIHSQNQSIAMHSHHSSCEILPDILHNHIPPPYTTLPMQTHCQINGAASVITQTPLQSVLVPGSSTLIPAIGMSDDGRYTFPLPIIRR